MMPWLSIGEAMNFDPKSEWWNSERVEAMERSVLGALLTVGELTKDVEKIIDADDFMVESHRMIFRAITSVFDNCAPDLVLVAHELDKRGQMDKVGAAYLSHLVDVVPAVDSAVAYAREIKACSVMRNVKRYQK
jgi:replicative DNA helicase